MRTGYFPEMLRMTRNDRQTDRLEAKEIYDIQKADVNSKARFAFNFNYE